jgi:hypothetical protein
MSLRARAPLAVGWCVCASIAVQEPFAHGADTAAACASAYERTQLLRQSGKLLEAREAAVACSRPACPEVARKDCEAWAAEMARETPSVVVVAQTQYYVDEHAARVVVDGAEREDAESGRAFELNPGEHLFHVERPGYEPIERTVVVAQGERDRILRFALQPTTPAKAPAAPGLGPGLDPGSRARANYLPAIVTAGVSAAMFAVSGYLGLTGRNDLAAMKSSGPSGCAPNCTDDAVDALKRKLSASDILLGAGILGAAGTTYLVLRPPTSPATTAPRIRVIPARTGATLAVEGTL